MRRLVYDVITNDGRIFTTFSYAVATAPNNKIERTYLIPTTLEPRNRDAEKIRLERIVKRAEARKRKKEM